MPGSNTACVDIAVIGEQMAIALLWRKEDKVMCCAVECDNAELLSMLVTRCTRFKGDTASPLRERKTERLGMQFGMLQW